jgi:hypothetical protein
MINLENLKYCNYKFLGSFGINYIIFRNAETLQILLFLKEQFFVKEKSEEYFTIYQNGMFKIN